MEENGKREGSFSSDPTDNIKHTRAEILQEDYFDDILQIDDSDLDEIKSISSISSNASVSHTKSIQVIHLSRWRSLLYFFLPCKQFQTVDGDEENGEELPPKPKGILRSAGSRRGGRHGSNVVSRPLAQSTPLISRGSLRARRYGYAACRNTSPDLTPLLPDVSAASLPRSPSPPIVTLPINPEITPLNVKPQNKLLSKIIFLPLWEDNDVPTLRWEDPVNDGSANQILGEHHHVFLKKQTRTGIRVIMWGKQHVVVDFEAPPLIDLPIPRLYFEDIMLLLPKVICVQFVLGTQFRNAGKMSVVHIDLDSEINLVSGKLLPPPNKMPHKSISIREYKLNFGQYSRIPVDSAVTLTICGKDNTIRAAKFNFEAYVVSQRRVEHFPWNRLIVGRSFIENFAVGMHGDGERGQLYLEDEYHNIYSQSYQRKTGNF